MTNTAAGASLWQQSIDTAKAEILGPEMLTAPEPLVNLANRQLLPVIEEMEQLLTAPGTVNSTAFIHMNYVKNGYVDAAIEAMEEVLGNEFFSRSCGRFVERYERVFAERGITAPSPA